MRSVMIAGTRSGCGKTTITCGILSALKNRGLKIASFKCGPDYIDPAFHRAVIGTDSHNLDSFFCDDKTLRYIFKKYGEDKDISIIEGVMGFFDGGNSSAKSISDILSVPVIIVIDCKGMSDSIEAIMKGYLSHCNSNNIAGFIFNRLPIRLLSMVKQFCLNCGTNFYGIMPDVGFTFESRNLGLVMAGEITDIDIKLQTITKAVEENILIDKILELYSSNFDLVDTLKIKRFFDAPSIAIANDQAFCFLYSENIALLEEMGCKITFFSPLNDNIVPESDGMIIPGGYPEIFAEKLSSNKSMLSSIREKIESGLPTIAECGGFMILHNNIACHEGEYKMSGVFDATTFQTDKLTRFGYIKMTASFDNLICKKGDTILAHEFHYFDSTDCGSDFLAEKKDGRNWNCCYTSESVYAGFPHLYFYSNLKIAENFVQKCCEYKKKKGDLNG